MLAGAAGQGVAETEELARPTGGGARTLGAGGLAELTGVLLLRHGKQSGRGGPPPTIGEHPETSPMLIGNDPRVLAQHRGAA